MRMSIDLAVSLAVFLMIVTYAVVYPISFVRKASLDEATWAASEVLLDKIEQTEIPVEMTDVGGNLTGSVHLGDCMYMLRVDDAGISASTGSDFSNSIPGDTVAICGVIYEYERNEDGIALKGNSGRIDASKFEQLRDDDLNSLKKQLGISGKGLRLKMGETHFGGNPTGNVYVRKRLAAGEGGINSVQMEVW